MTCGSYFRTNSKCKNKGNRHVYLNEAKAGYFLMCDPCKSHYLEKHPEMGKFNKKKK